MIFCTVKPINEYVVEYGGATLGIYDTYRSEPEVLNLITITTPIPFHYEPGFENINKGKVICSCSKDQLLRDSLEDVIGGVKLKELLHNLSPSELLGVFKKEGVGSLSNMYGDAKVLFSIMSLREMVYRKYWKGKAASNGKVISVQFRSPLTREEEQHVYDCVKQLKDQIGAA